jgi:hypothetical protein
MDRTSSMMARFRLKYLAFAANAIVTFSPGFSMDNSELASSAFLTTSGLSSAPREEEGPHQLVALPPKTTARSNMTLHATRRNSMTLLSCASPGRRPQSESIK